MHLRKPRVFGPLRSPNNNNYSGSGLDRKPLACEDVLNDVPLKIYLILPLDYQNFK